MNRLQEHSHKKDLRFLQTLISDDPEQQLQTTDSDKENEARLNMTTEKGSSVSILKQPAEIKMLHSSATEGAGSGVNNMRREKDKIWDDFLTEEEINKRKEVKDKINDGNAKEIAESLRKIMKDEEENVGQSQGSDEREDKADDIKESSKRRKKRLFRQVTHTIAPTATGGSHPDLGRHDSDKRHHDNHVETMSEISGRSGRRLGRRRRVAPPRCAGPAQAGDVLEQKVQELHALIVKPLFEPKQHSLQPQIEQLYQHRISHHHHAAHVRKPLSAEYKIRREQHDQVPEESRLDNSDDCYPTLRAAQLRGSQHTKTRTSGKTVKQAHSGQERGEKSPSDARGQDNNIQTSKGNRHHSPDKSVTDQRERGQDKERESKGSYEKNSNEDAKNSDSVRNNNVRNSVIVTNDVNVRNKSPDKHESLDRSNEPVRSNSSSPVRASFHISDTHLKNSNNPALRKWLRKKNKEFRRQKAEERKKKREERSRKQDELRARQDVFKDSSKKVQEWMEQKEKEARKRAKEEKKFMREEKKRLEKEQQRQRLGVLRTRSLERPLSAPTQSGKRTFIPIIRPETSLEEKTYDMESEGQLAETYSSQSHETKFVYKRPVSGHVRLMKLQQKLKQDEKRSEHQKKMLKKKLAEEKMKKVRMSYDQWLLKKREEDYAKRQEVARQKALAKSDPELERILPELARRRIENIQQGKQRIDTGVNKLNEELNRSFGGADFGVETEQKNVTAQESSRIEISGQQKILKTRPLSARPTVNLRVSESSSRPKSANPRVQVLLDKDDKETSSQPKPFRLPFPPEHGAPKHVIAKQVKLFSPHVTQSKSSDISDSDGKQGEDTLKVSDSDVQTSTSLSGDYAAASENMVGDAKLDPDGQRPEDVLSQAADEDKSFFVTHGNLGDTDRNRTENYNRKDEEVNQPENMCEILKDNEVLETEAEIEDLQESLAADTEDSEQESMVREAEIENDVAAGEQNDVAAGEQNDVAAGEQNDVAAGEQNDVAAGEQNDDDKPKESVVNPNKKDEEEQLMFKDEADLPHHHADPRSIDTNNDLTEHDSHSELSDSKNFDKHHSFDEEAIVHNSPDILELLNTDEDNNEEAGNEKVSATDTGAQQLDKD